MNFTALAADVGVTFRYQIEVLQGRRNCTIALLERTAQALGLSLSHLIERIERANGLYLAAAPAKQKERWRKNQRRRMLDLM